jgi:hypothetical protein
VVDCTSKATDPLLCISLSPDTVVLDPRDYRTRPAVGYFGIKNDSLVEVFATPIGFQGDSANLLTVRDGEDIAVLPGKTLLLDVSYQPIAEQWQHGEYTAELALEIGWFNSDIKGPAAVRRREAGDSFRSSEWVTTITFEWDCDVDNDGYLADACGQDDCNDQNERIHPDAEEICDRADNNCNGVADDDPVDGRTFYEDLDNDGWGATESSVVSCVAPTNSWVTTPGDCDDAEAFVKPGGYEFCDGMDNDCDDEIDEGCEDDDVPVESDSADTDPVSDSDSDRETDAPDTDTLETGMQAPDTAGN